MSILTELAGFDRFEARLIELKRKLESASQSVVAVGVRGGGNEALIATVQEYGTVDGKIPSRPFMRISLGKPELRTFVAKQAGDFYAAKVDMSVALGRIGAFSVGLIQSVIASNIPPENKPSTIRQKGSTSTLIDTGRMRQSVSFEIREAGK